MFWLMLHFANGWVHFFTWVCNNRLIERLSGQFGFKLPLFSESALAALVPILPNCGQFIYEVPADFERPFKLLCKMAAECEV